MAMGRGTPSRRAEARISARVPKNAEVEVTLVREEEG
jgi:hypothetical protein